MKAARAALALLLAVAIPVRAETTTDPLWFLLSTYVLAPDARAAEAGSDGPADAKGLAALQSDLLVLSEGFEGFRDEAQVKETLERLQPRMSPELRPFFKDRRSSLDAIYRTLAVTDYTWAQRFPEPPCAPLEARRRLLAGRDGLFQSKTGEASPWLVSLLGPRAAGQSAEAALDQASSQTRLSGAGYEKLRARIRKLNAALASDKAVGAARAKLYCFRAAAFKDLAAFHRTEEAPLISTSRTVSQTPEKSVFGVVHDGRIAAAVLVKTRNGTFLVTDAAVVANAEQVRLVALSDNDKPLELKATVIRRSDSGVAVLAYTDVTARPTLTLADAVPAKDDLVTAVGHTRISGFWTKTSGLVTKAGENNFQTDAAISPEFVGGPVLNEAGEVAGILVLRPAEIEEGHWPIAIPAPTLAKWLDDSTYSMSASTGTEIIEDAGTAAILSRTRPHGLTDAGLGDWNIPNLPPPPPSPRGVCVSNCGGMSSPSRSYSSYSGGSYSSGNAELGQALGELGAVLILKGIPALFRGIAKLFKGSEKPASPAIVKSRPAEVIAAPAPPPKPVPPKLAGLDLQIDPDELIEGESLTAIATLRFTGDAPKKNGIRVTFTPSGSKRSYSALTDAAGIAKVTIDTDSTEADRERPFEVLKGEEQRQRGEEPATFLIPNRPPKTEVDKVKQQRAPDAFSSLDREEMRNEELTASEAPGSDSDPVPPVDESSGITETGASPGFISPPSSGLPPNIPRDLQPAETVPDDGGAEYEDEVPDDNGKSLTLTAIAFAGSMGSAKKSGEFRVLSQKCPPGMVAPPPPEASFPGHPPTGSLTKAELEGECRPIEEIAQEVCGAVMSCQHGVLRVLDYDYETCLDRWKQDGDSSPGSLGQPPLTRPPSRTVNRRCVPAKKIRTQSLPKGNYAKKGPHTGRKYNVSPGAREAYRSMIKLLLRGARFFRDSFNLIMQKTGDMTDANTDFDAVTRGVQVRSRHRGMRTATLADGTRITVRPFSSAGSPTIEVIGPNGEHVKIRYIK